MKDWFLLFMALFMSFIMSFIITFINLGFIDTFVSSWLKAHGELFVLFYNICVAPIVHKIVRN